MRCYGEVYGYFYVAPLVVVVVVVVVVVDARMRVRYEYNQRTRLVDRRGVPKAAKECFVLITRGARCAKGVSG